jgi:hypothetical protein
MAIKASKQWTLGLVLLQTLGPGHGAAVTLHFGWWLEWVSGLKPTRIGILLQDWWKLSGPGGNSIN